MTRSSSTSTSSTPSRWWSTAWSCPIKPRPTLTADQRRHRPHRRLGRAGAQAGQRHGGRGGAWARRRWSTSSPSTSPASTTTSRSARSSRARFSFNSPHGACPDCTGLGHRLEVDPDLVIPNRSLSIETARSSPGAGRRRTATSGTAILSRRWRKHRGFSMTAPIADLSEDDLNVLLYGTEGRAHPDPPRARSGAAGSHEYKVEYEGVITNLERRYKETESDYMRDDIERYMAKRPCPAARARGSSPRCSASRVIGRPIDEVTNFSVVNGAWVLQRPRRPRSPFPELRGPEQASTGQDPLQGRARADADRARLHDCAADPEGDPRPARVPGGCGAGLPDAGPDGRHALRRRGAAHPPGHADRLGPDGRAVHPGRAEHRAAPARQRPADHAR